MREGCPGSAGTAPGKGSAFCGGPGANGAAGAGSGPGSGGAGGGSGPGPGETGGEPCVTSGEPCGVGGEPCGTGGAGGANPGGGTVPATSGPAGVAGWAPKGAWSGLGPAARGSPGPTAVLPDDPTGDDATNEPAGGCGAPDGGAPSGRGTSSGDGTGVLFPGSPPLAAAAMLGRPSTDAGAPGPGSPRAARSSGAGSRASASGGGSWPWGTPLSLGWPAGPAEGPWSSRAVMAVPSSRPTSQSRRRGRPAPRCER